MSTGTLDTALVHPREVLKSAILSNAYAIMLVHNHPSGSLEPSKYDIQTTDQLSQACALMDIPILDHVIVGSGKQYYSFMERKILPVSRKTYAESLEELKLHPVRGRSQMQ